MANNNWNVIGNTFKYYISPDIKNVEKLAFFDLDGTLITSASGKNPKYKNCDPQDWIYLGDVIDTLKIYIENKFTIVIVTNQSHLNQKNGDCIQDKLDSVLNDLKAKYISVIFLVSSGKDEYRKPK